jgi:hypothetical protein
VRITAYLSLVDITVAVVVAVAVLMPPRLQSAAAVAKLDEDAQWGLAASEARLLARPGDAAAATEQSRRLREARLLDWAIEVPALAVADAGEAPGRWRAMLATSAAYAERLDVQEALDWAQRALAVCGSSSDACPSWEQVRMELYARHLEGGIKSGIDPRKDPEGFRRAGEQGLRQIRLNDPARSGAAPPP